MRDPITVLKFGGTSVEDAAAMERVAGIVRARSGGRVVVVSALSGVTDALLRAAARAAGGDAAGARAELEPQLDRHRAIAERLLTPAGAREARAVVDAAGARLADLLGRAQAEPRDDRVRDAIAACGEDLSAPLVAFVLAAAGVPGVAVDPRRCIVTDDTPGGGVAREPATGEHTRATLEPLLAAGRVPVLGGFIGATSDGVTTTLGRGGSDVTAALVGAALGAQEIQIWTDVPGVLTADPRVVPDARSIARLSYAEAAELAYFGAKVLHPRTIEPAVARGIPVRILDSRQPHGGNTLVTGDAEGRHTIKAIAHKTGISVVQITAARMLGTYGFLHALFEVFTRHRAVVDVVTTSEVSVSLTLEHPEPRPELLLDLARLGALAVERDKAIICVVGDGLRDAPGIAARVFEAVGDINIHLISQGASRVNLTFVVDAKRVNDVVQRVHTAVFATPFEPSPTAV